MNIKSFINKYNNEKFYAMSNDQNVAISNKRLYRPGFKIGWDLYGFKDEFLFELNWMYNDIKSESSKKASNLISIYLPLNAFTIPDAFYRSSGKNNVLDLSLSKPYHISRYVVGKRRLNPCFIKSR
jgi:hypothetical protein